MMVSVKRELQLNNLDCASCAAKIEESIRNITGVTDAQVNFMAKKMVMPWRKAGLYWRRS